MAKIDVFKAANTTGIAINSQRITKTKPYGLVETVQSYDVNDDKILSSLNFDKPVLSKEEYNSLCEKMADCANSDTEEGHIAADHIFVEALEKMGYKKLVELYLKLDKWYS